MDLNSWFLWLCFFIQLSIDMMKPPSSLPLLEREREGERVVDFVRQQVPDWDNDVLAMARFKAFTGQRSDWEPRYLFWRDLILKVARHLGLFILQPSHVRTFIFSHSFLLYFSFFFLAIWNYLSVWFWSSVVQPQLHLEITLWFIPDAPFFSFFGLKDFYHWQLCVRLYRLRPIGLLRKG